MQPPARRPPANRLSTGRPSTGRSSANHASAGRPGRHRRRRHLGAATPAVISLLFLAGLAYQGFAGGISHLAAPAASPTTAVSSSAVPPPSAMTPPPSAMTPPPVVAPPSTAPPRPAAVAFLNAGTGVFAYAPGPGPLLGTAGVLWRFRVAVEFGAGQDPASFAATVDRVLGDPRSWIASKRLRLQRVPQAADAEFTIFLATPGTSERMCAAGGLDTEAYTSCRLPGQVIINAARWLGSVPGYGAPLATYQAYAINHEVGHQLGQGHEACPGPGRPAPVMQQQTLRLAGCVANGWPYLNGRRYQGPPVA
jgi:hypothetical protein